MFKKHPKILSVTLAAAYTALCVLCVSVAVLYTPANSPADTKENHIEYTPPAPQTEYILLCCEECKNDSVLIIDYEQKDVSLITLLGDYDYEFTAKITFNEKLISALADGAGGVNFTLQQDNALLEAGSWRLTGNQVWQLLHLGDITVYEQLVSELFYAVFMFGLQNSQIYIILEYGICDSLSYSRLYNIAYYSKDWLSQLTVVS